MIGKDDRIVHNSFGIDSENGQGFDDGDKRGSTSLGAFSLSLLGSILA